MHHIPVIIINNKHLLYNAALNKETPKKTQTYKIRPSIC